jgi:short-subunit dehydrogenase
VEIGGKRILLTGATGGLGRAIAVALAARGGRLVLTARREEELLSLAQELPGDGHTILVADLALEGSAVRVASEAGEVDVLVANAGVPGGGRLERFSQEELGRALRVNFESPIAMAREVLPGMLERDFGHLVFVSSLQGKVAFSRSSVYSATKFGLRGFALSLRDDLHGTGVGCSLVLPGFIREAGMFADSGQGAPAGLGTSTPEAVGAGVVRAIERDRAELVVAPRRQALAAGLGHRMPRLASLLTRRSSAKVADRVVDGQAGKR